MKIGITGSKGFIGGSLVRSFSGNKSVKFSFFDLPEHDLLRGNAVDLIAFVKNNDVIVHAAVINRGNDADVIAGSIVTTHHLISAIEKYNRRAKLIFFSSVQVETATLYGQCKKITELMLEDISKRLKIPVSIFRMSNLFGEYSRPFYTSVVATFCYQVAHNSKLTVHPESRNKVLNLVYVGDIVKMIRREIIIKRARPFYFKRVSTKDEITVGDLAKLISSFKAKKMTWPKSDFHKKLYKTYVYYERKT